MPNSKFFRFGYGILLIFLIIWVGVKINFIFHPLAVMFQTLFAPLLIAGIGYYLLRPIVQLLTRKRVPRTLAILTVYLAITCLLALLFIFVYPMIKRQFNDLAASLPSLLQTAISKVNQLAGSEWFNKLLENFDLNLQQLTAKASEFAMILVDLLGTNITYVIGFVTNLVLLAVVVPFILFYVLKDGEKMSGGLVKLLPEKNRKDGRKLLSEMDETISLYVRGQITVAICVGVLLLIGYLIIGLNYAVLLALAAMMTNVIPYVGAFIAAAPAVLIAMGDSPGMVVKVLIVTIVAQQIESNLVSPQIMGKTLEIHPLTIILLLLVVGTLTGPVGLLLAVPTYAVTKIVVTNVYRFIKLRNSNPVP
ncbi:AI-2E family transporter [Paenibacillus spongiae]|uniref:AI-2E family transporter n=1 Tax=Paenibacillus spongiae TaxID=2909671 RepID=A0ABY5S3U2_9BACL|nr:AI-2E family transporter [Paenibacillus spongiae]UVI28562.1 AI-2E family transporter [Paenibacillus spongiae]